MAIPKIFQGRPELPPSMPPKKTPVETTEGGGDKTQHPKKYEKKEEPEQRATTFVVISTLFEYTKSLLHAARLRELKKIPQRA